MEQSKRKRLIRKRLIRIAQILASVAIIVAIFGFAIPKFANYGDVWNAVKSMTWLEIFSLIAVSLFNIFTYWPQMTASLPGLTLAQAAVNNQSSTAIANTIPFGGLLANGVSYTMYRSWGFTNAEIGLTTIVTALWNTFVKLVMPVLALIALIATRRATGSLVAPTVVGVVVLVIALGLFAVVLAEKSWARALGGGAGKIASLVRKPFGKPAVHWGQAGAKLRHQTISLIGDRWSQLTIFSFMSHFGLYLVLLLALRNVGISEKEINWAQVLGVFAFVRLISLVPITPGGVGLVELGYIGALYVAGKPHADVPLDMLKAQITAAVLVFRTLTFVLQIPMGVVTYVIWRQKKSWRKPVPHEPAEPSVVERVPS
jgi:putative heme transporter